MLKLFRQLLNSFLTLVIIVAIGVAIGGYLYNKGYHDTGPLERDTVFIVMSGQSTSQIADNMEAQGVINNALIFKLATRIRGVSKALHAGEYEIQAGSSVKSIIDLMIMGKIKQYKITIPEGLTGYQILNILKKEKNMVGIPPKIIIEGSVLPDTYYYTRGEDMNAVLGRMQTAMTETMNELWADRAKGLPFKTTNDAITLASIVEKETGIASERQRVAGLFINRLKKDMPLQSDPTVIYALTEGKIEDNGMGPLGRRLLRKDLTYDSLYNTYKYPGLPPGPIANPGIDSIKAVMHPEQHQYYYMVADGTGGHAFATTLREHNSNVEKWRAIRKQQLQNGNE